MPDASPLRFFVEAVPEGQEESYLVQLGNRLREDPLLAITGLSHVRVSGLGGIGKSSLAFRYAYLAKNNNLYDVVHWVEAETELGIRESYKKLLKKLGQPFEGIDHAQVLENLKKTLASKTFLLIYDNVPVLYGKKRSDNVLAKLLPQEGHENGHGHFLMTSRRVSDSSNDQWDNFSLGVWRPEESIAYLIQRTGLEAIETLELHKIAGEIAEEMGHLPLALDHAGAYLKQKKCHTVAHFSKYLKNFRTKRSTLKGFRFRGSDDKTVATTWQMTLDETSPLCHQIIAYCSYLNPDKIPVGLLNPSEDDDITKAIETLDEYSMISYEGSEFISVHRLVQWVIRHKPSSLDRSFFCTKMPNMIVNYVQRSFTPDISYDSIRKKTLNILQHSIVFIGQAKTCGYNYAFDNPLILIGQVMGLCFIEYLYSEDLEEELPDCREVEKNLPVFFSEVSSCVFLDNLAKHFKNCHPIVHFGFGLCYERVKSYKKAVEWWKEAANYGHAGAQFKLGNAYSQGKGVLQDYKKAFKFFTWASDQKYVMAFFNLGNAYSNGRGIEKDNAQAFELWTKAAEKGVVSAQFNLGNVYYEGRGIEKNDEQAVEWWTKAAMSGHVRAQCKLAYAYDQGEGVAEDHERAVIWYKNAANQGYAEAQHSLGYAYYIKKDDKEAVKWWKKAAKQGCAKAQYNLGISYDQGRGEAHDDDLAIYWYFLAAEKGHEGAQFNLGCACYKRRGIEKDNKDAVKWWTKAADQGHVEAMYYLGLAYYQGEGVDQKYEEAVKWWTKAADQGHVEAMYYLGLAYAKGNGLDEDPEQAVVWWRQAAEKGDEDAQFKIGYAYYRGEGVDQNYEEAVAWYRKAADQGHVVAQYNLGISYSEGKGVPQDHVQAFDWWKKAARQEYKHAQFKLGCAYFEGRVIEKDDEEAVEWWTKAAEQGHEKAQLNLVFAYFQGKGVAKDYNKAFEWWWKVTRQMGAKSFAQWYFWQIVGALHFSYSSVCLWLQRGDGAE